jgi:hypothetical protein
VSAGAVAPAAAADNATTSVTVSARFESRTSLKVSDRVLRFEVESPAQAATAAIEFDAGARTRAGGEVVLTVESVRATHGPGGAGDADTSLEFAGEGDGALSGSLAPSAPAVAGRWVGSGKRTGRLVFALRASAPGHYTLPVRFVLSAP